MRWVYRKPTRHRVANAGWPRQVVQCHAAGADRPFPLQQTDVGPAPYTGRGVDISAAAAHQMGYTPKTFQTDANYKVEPIDLTGLGLAASYMGGVPGDNQTAVASGPPARKYGRQ